MKLMLLLLAASMFLISACASTGSSTTSTPKAPHQIISRDYDKPIDSIGNRIDSPKKLLDTSSISKLSTATRLLLSTIDNYVEVAPESKRIPEVMILKGHTYYNNRLFNEARMAYLKIIDSHNSAREMPEAIKMTAQSYYEEKKFTEAQEWYRKLKDVALTGTEKEEASVRLSEAYFRQGEALKTSGNGALAIAEFERIVIEFPSSAIADAALYNIGLIRDERKEWTQALLSFNKLIANYPKSTYVEQSFFRIAKDYEQINNWSRAAATYLEAIQRFPASSQIKDAVYNAALAYEKAEDYPASAKLFEKYAAEWPADKEAPDVLFKAGELYGKIEDWTNVERINSLFSKRYGNDKERVVMAICMAGVASYMQKKYDQAIIEFERAVTTGKKAGLDIKANSYYAAKAQFTIGEIRQFQAEQISLSTANYAANLKTRIKLTEEAVSAYTRVSHYKLMEWTVKAIYKIGETYEQFGVALFKRERPANLSLKKLLELEEGIAAAVEKYLSIKALEAHEQNVKFGIQYQYEDEWIKKSRQQLTKLPFLTARNYTNLIRIASSGQDKEIGGSAMKQIQKKLETLQLIAPFQDKAIALSLKTLEMSAKYTIEDKYKLDASAEVTKLSFEVGATYAEIVSLARSAPIPPSYDRYKKFFYKVHLLGEGLVEYENLAITSLYKNIKIGEAYSIKDEWIRKSKEKIAEVLFTRSMCYEILSNEALKNPPIPEGVSDVEAEEYQLQFEELGYKLQDEALSIYRDIYDKGKEFVTTGPYLDAAYTRLFAKNPREVGEQVVRDTLITIRTDKEWFYSSTFSEGWWKTDFSDTAWITSVKGVGQDSIVPTGFSEIVNPIWGSDTVNGSHKLREKIYLRKYFRSAVTPTRATLEFAAPGPCEIWLNGERVFTDTLPGAIGWYRAKKISSVAKHFNAGKNCLAIMVTSSFPNIRKFFLLLSYEDKVTETLPKLPSTGKIISRSELMKIKYIYPVIPNFEHDKNLFEN